MGCICGYVTGGEPIDILDLVIWIVYIVHPYLIVCCFCYENDFQKFEWLRIIETENQRLDGEEFSD